MMAMDYFFKLQGRASSLAVVVSLWFLVRLWREGELFGTQQIVFTAWFVVAAITLLVAPTAMVWIAGLVAQVLLAIVLILKDQIDNIY
jgi:hypothetical protein